MTDDAGASGPSAPDAVPAGPTVPAVPTVPAGAKIGLVVGAGGAVGGAFHAGVLTALHESFAWDARDAEPRPLAQGTPTSPGARASSS